MLNHGDGTNDTLRSNELTLGKILGDDHGDKTSALFVPLEMGENQAKLVIVDGCWSDITEDLRENTASSLATWSEALRLRLSRRTQLRRMSRLLRDAQRLLLPLEKIMRWQFPALAHTVFDAFLSDVQVYAEFTPARQAAIKRLSGYLDDIVAQHQKIYGADAADFDISIVAHSLGTVASLDTLAAAALIAPDQQVSWYKHLKHFITLGSPIDKFLVLWSENYRPYHVLAERRSEPAEPRIQFWNYCDELDPVGHHIDLLKKLPWSEKLFDYREDVVYTRYRLPGKAHIDYWHDEQLMARLQKIITHQLTEPQKKPGPNFKLTSYVVTLVVTYVAAPVALTLAAWAMASTVDYKTLWQLRLQDDTFWQSTISLLATAGLLIAGSLGLRVLFMWRQINVHLARRTENKSSNRRSFFGKLIIWGCFRLSALCWFVVTTVSWWCHADYPIFFGVMTLMSLVVWLLFEYSRRRAKVAVQELAHNRDLMRDSALSGPLSAPTT